MAFADNNNSLYDVVMKQSDTKEMEGQQPRQGESLQGKALYEAL